MTTITVPRAVLEQALEALEEFGTHYEHCPRYPTWARPELQPPCNCGLDSNVAALRAALAQQEQEPVAWMLTDDSGMRFVSVDRPHPDFVPLHTTPPRREWQSLTNEEIYPLYNEPRSDAEMLEFARAVEAKLKEKNNG
jgi:hypothetical protein